MKQRQIMEEKFKSIQLNAEDGHVRAEPDLLRVLSGTEVRWYFTYWGRSREVVFEIVFDNGSPFSASRIIHHSQQSTNTMLSSGEATASGDYKYSIHVRDSLSGKLIAEEDPRIVVIQR